MVQSERAKHAVVIDGMLGTECRRLEDALDRATVEADSLRETCAKLTGERSVCVCVYTCVVLFVCKEADSLREKCAHIHPAYKHTYIHIQRRFEHNMHLPACCNQRTVRSCATATTGDTQVHIRIHVCMYACMHVCMYACMHVCMYACMHVCM